MAYVSKEKKEAIRAELKKVMPACWKWSLAVRHGSTIVLTIYSAPINLVAEYYGKVPNGAKSMPDHADVNHYHAVRYMKERDNPSVVADLFEKIIAALNCNNHDNSDYMTDYFDVGHYIDFNLGKWGKPFKVTGDEVRKEAA